MCDEWTDYPDEPSWELAHDALAFESDEGWCKQHELLDQAVANAGAAETVALIGDRGITLMLAPVEWRTRPWLAIHRHEKFVCETFLFQCRSDAEEWATRRADHLRELYYGSGC